MKKLIGKFIVLLLLVSAINGCENRKNDKGIIKIGVILPLTGELASYGNPMRIGIEMAYNEIDNSKYKLIIVDSKGENNTAVSALQKLISIDGVKYVIGDVSSSTTLAMVGIAEKNEVLILSPGASSPKLQNISPFFARNYPSSIEESVNSASFINANFNKESVAVIYANDEYGIGLASLFKKEFENYGGVIIMFESYENNQTDFKTLLSKIKQKEPKIIYLAGNQKEMGRFMRQFHEMGINSQIVSSISFLEADCLNVAGDAANGAIVPLPYYNPEDTIYEGAYKFGKLFYNKHGQKPTVAEAVGYDAVKLMIKAIETGNDSTTQAAAYLRNLKNYDGALGLLNFRDGEVSIPVTFKVVINGKPVDLIK